MRIIVVGGAGTIGTAVVEHLSARHDVIVAGRRSGDVQVDINPASSSPASWSARADAATRSVLNAPSKGWIAPPLR